jgi:hypothetical protein
MTDYSSPSRGRRAAWLFGSYVMPFIFRRQISRYLDVMPLRIIERGAALLECLNFMAFLVTARYDLMATAMLHTGYINYLFINCLI